MKLHLKLLLPALFGSAVACSSGHNEAHHGGEHAGHEGEHHEHGAASAPVADFHSVLAPLWHSDKGPERVTKVCDQAKTLHERAAAVEAMTPPKEPDHFKADAKELTASVDALVAACAADGRPDVEAKLSDVHDKYHHVAEHVGDGHHDGGEHHEEPKH